MKRAYVIASIVAVVGIAALAIFVLKRRQSASPTSGCNPRCSSALQSCVNNSCVPSGTALRALSLQITSGQSSGSYLTCNTIIGDTRLIVPESAKDTSWLYCFAPISGSFVPGLYYQLDDGETFSPAVVQFQVGSTLVFGAQMTGTSYGSVVLDFERVPNSSTSFALYLAFTYGSTPMKAYATEINTGFVTFDSTAKIDAALTLSVTFTA